MKITTKSAIYTHAFLQIADTLTTAFALSGGAQEGNPLMRYAYQSADIAGMISVKLLILTAASLLIVVSRFPAFNLRKPFIFLNLIYFGIFINNVGVILKTF